MQRERALAAFRAGRLDVLVATDVAARGIHVDAVPLVVHFDPPADSTDYVHRSGRTGRAGADGRVVSLIGTEHLHGARLLTRQLGIADGISAPDVPALSRAAAGSAPAFRSSEPGTVRRQSAVASARSARGRPRSQGGPVASRRRSRNRAKRSQIR
jgi:superfamily II DNA/RNA helicase